MATGQLLRFKQGMYLYKGEDKQIWGRILGGGKNSERMWEKEEKLSAWEREGVTPREKEDFHLKYMVFDEINCLSFPL